MQPVYFVSLGPGHYSKLTLEAVALLRWADRIVCFATQREGQLASRTLDTLLQFDKQLAQKAEVVELPMSMQRDEALSTYDTLVSRLATWHHDGMQVAVCVEGSSGIYSSVQYVMQRLEQAGVPCIESAGIPSFVEAAAHARLKLCEQDERLLVVPGRIEAEEIAELVSSRTTVVVMKLSRCTEAVHRCMRQHPEFHYHYAANIGMPHQHATDDATEILAIHPFPYFSIMIIKATP